MTTTKQRPKANPAQADEDLRAHVHAKLEVGVKQRRKSDEARKDTNLRMRVSAAQLEELKAAAEKACISLSAWAIERLMRVARQEQKE